MAEEEFEYFEMEVSEEDIVCYLVDEDDKEVGFVVMEDGEEVEYFYADEEGVEYEYVDEEPAYNAQVADGARAANAVEAAGASSGSTPRESRIKPLSEVKPGVITTSAAGTAGATGAAGAVNTTSAKSGAPKDGIEQATDKVIETIKSDDFKSAARDFGAFAQETADATKELREVYKDVKDTIDMFNPKKIFK